MHRVQGVNDDAHCGGGRWQRDGGDEGVEASPVRASEQRARTKDNLAWEGAEAGGMPGSAARRSVSSPPGFEGSRALGLFVMMTVMGASSPQLDRGVSPRHANEEPFARGGSWWRLVQWGFLRGWHPNRVPSCSGVPSHEPSDPDGARCCPQPWGQGWVMPPRWTVGWRWQSRPVAPVATGCDNRLQP